VVSFKQARWTNRREIPFEPTLEIHLEKGKPLSREKAQSSLDVAANVVMLPAKMRRNRTTDSKRATGVDPVLVNRTRKGASESIALSRSPIQNNMVMSMMVPMTAFPR
jgi:hypothetical protein